MPFDPSTLRRPTPPKAAAPLTRPDGRPLPVRPAILQPGGRPSFAIEAPMVRGPRPESAK